jgi:hypothetical protein
MHLSSSGAGEPEGEGHRSPSRDIREVKCLDGIWESADTREWRRERKALWKLPARLGDRTQATANSVVSITDTER